MDDVDGEAYERGQVASTFKADHASANRAEQILTLTGHVRAYSESQRTTIACDKLEWHAKDQIVKAFGHIEVRGKFAILSGLDEVWATPELNYFASPAMFKRPEAPVRLSRPNARKP